MLTHPSSLCVRYFYNFCLYLLPIFLFNLITHTHFRFLCFLTFSLLFILTAARKKMWNRTSFSKLQFLDERSSVQFFSDFLRTKVIDSATETQLQSALQYLYSLFIYNLFKIYCLCRGVCVFVKIS